MNKYLENKYISKLSDLGIFEITSPNFLSTEKIKDESGILTSNVGFINYENGNLEIGLNLRVPVNTPLEEKTGLNEEPIAIGGGTYARAFPNIVAFGANMPGHVDLCHQVNEYIDIDTLIDSAKIYAEAIYRLGK